MRRRHAQEQRQWLAEQAARWMHEHALDDPAQALRRVLARQPSPPDRRLWPESEEILSALRTYQRLFRPAGQVDPVAQRRQAALEALSFFTAWHPRLVGSVLEGTADLHSPVQLHLHADESEPLLGFMTEQGIPYRLGERTLQLNDQSRQNVPHIRFEADGITFELWVLPAQAERQPPLATDGRGAMRRVSRTQLLALMRTPVEPDPAP